MHQREAIKYSINYYSSKKFTNLELDGLNTTEKIELLKTKDFDWQALPNHIKQGTVIRKVLVDLQIPNLSDDAAKIKIYGDKEIPEFVQRNKLIISNDTPYFSENKNYIEEVVYAGEGINKPLLQLHLNF